MYLILVFGDLDETTGEISDIVVTNNNSHKVRLCEVSDFEVLFKCFSTIDYATQYPIATCISGNLMHHSFTALPVYTNNRSYKYVADRSDEYQTKIIRWENPPPSSAKSPTSQLYVNGFQPLIMQLNSREQLCISGNPITS